MIFRNPVVLLVSALSVTGCIVPGPAYQPGYGPSRGYDEPGGYGDQYNYTYYPEYGVYFDPIAAIWFWSEGGVWLNGPVLPGFYPRRLHGGVTIALDTRQPYTRHDYVMEHYGGPRSYGRGPGRGPGDGRPWHGRPGSDGPPGRGPPGGNGPPGRGPPGGNGPPGRGPPGGNGPPGHDQGRHGRPQDRRRPAPERARGQGRDQDKRD